MSASPDPGRRCARCCRWRLRVSPRTAAPGRAPSGFFYEGRTFNQNRRDLLPQRLLCPAFPVLRELLEVVLIQVGAPGVGWSMLANHSASGARRRAAETQRPWARGHRGRRRQGRRRGARSTICIIA